MNNKPDTPNVWLLGPRLLLEGWLAGGRQYWELGKYRYDIEAGRTFHEFVLASFRQLLTKEWIDGQLGKGHKQHYLALQFLHFERFRKGDFGEVRDEGTRFAATPTGHLATLRDIALDAQILLAHESLPRDLLDRLKGLRSFQGARFEMLVGAAFIRAGFQIEWHPPSQDSHCEFDAFEPGSQCRYAVEAKSRHWKGVLHGAEGASKTGSLKQFLDKKIKQACRQSNGHKPLLIFIDVNTKPEIGVRTEQTTWYREVKKHIDEQPESTAEAPEKYSAVFITNYASHYWGEDLSRLDEPPLTVQPFYAQQPVHDQRHMDVLRLSLNSYGSWPKGL